MDLSPEIIAKLLEVGGGPVAILIAFKWLFNGTGERIKGIETAVREGFKEVSEQLDDIGDTLHAQDKRISLLEEREEHGRRVAGL